MLPSDPNPSQARPRVRRSLHLALFGTSIAWAVVATLFAARAARGFTLRFQLSDEFLLLDAIFLVFLLGVGFTMLQSVFARNTPLRETFGLPRRPTAGTEWATGAAIGWGTILLAVLPMALAGDLHIRFWTEPRSFLLVLVNLATVAGLSLASEMAFRGYPYRRLVDAIGPSWATVIMALLFAALGGEDIHRFVAGYALPNAATAAIHERFGFKVVGVFSENGRKFGKYWDVCWTERAV